MAIEIRSGAIESAGLDPSSAMRVERLITVKRMRILDKLILALMRNEWVDRRDI
jgi:hypothetical protein